MFIFSTNTLINNYVGYPGGFMVDDNLLKKSDVSKDLKGQKIRWYVDNTDSENPVLRIGRDFRFAKANVVKVYKREHNDPQFAKVLIDPSVITEAGIYRVAIYIRLSQGSQNSYYANALEYKGKPFYVEFEVKEAEVGQAEKIAKKVVNISKKYFNMVYEYPLLKMYVEDNKIAVEATDEYQRFLTCELQQLAPANHTFDCCHVPEIFKAIDALPNDENHNKIDWDVDDETGKKLKGREGFGTYRQITHDLRLPTAANTRWNRIAIDETPILGAVYDEYIIYMCVNRGIMGGDAVGELVKSGTHHVFYVKHDQCDDLIKDWEEALLQVADEIEVVNKDIDDEDPTDINDPEANDAALNSKMNKIRTAASSDHETAPGSSESGNEGGNGGETPAPEPTPNPEPEPEP